MKDNLIYAVISVVIACAIGGLIYGGYLLIVREAITEMVKQSCLK